MKKMLIFFSLLVWGYLYGHADADTIKPGLVLRPFITDGVSDTDNRLFEAEIKKELQKKFTVLSGEILKSLIDKINVDEPATGELFIKTIGESFNAKFFGVVGIGKDHDDSYRFELRIYSVVNEGELFSETSSCHGCDTTDALKQLKSLCGRVSPNTSGDRIIRRNVQEKYGKHFFEISMGYVPLTFADVDIEFMLAGIKYSFAKKDIGTLYIELQHGVSSDTFYYGDQTELIEIDGGDADVLRIGFNYLLINDFMGLSLGIGGGYEILGIDFNSSSGSCKVAKNSPYVETGVGYSGKKNCMSLNGRYHPVDDEPEYKYSLSVTYGIHF